MSPSSRPCTGTTVRAKPCRAAALKGSDYCRAHDPDRPEEDRFGSSVQAREAGELGGRPKLPPPREATRRLIEAHVAEILAPHFKALGHQIVHDDEGLRLVPIPGGGAKLHGTSKDGVVKVSRHDDLAAQMAAAEKLLDRVYGRPKQATEVSGPDGGPIALASEVDLTKLSDEELQQLRSLLALAEAGPE